MATCPTTRIKNKYGPGYAIKNTADLSPDDEIWGEVKKPIKKTRKKTAKKPR